MVERRSKMFGKGFKIFLSIYYGIALADTGERASIHFNLPSTISTTFFKDLLLVVVFSEV
jgi:hypothetical protein